MQCVEKLVFFHFKRRYLAICAVKISEIFSTHLLLVRCKILQLGVKKKITLIILLIAIEMAVFRGVSQEKGLGPLGVKRMSFIFIFLFIS